LRVPDAIARGLLDPRRFVSYTKLPRELAFVDRKGDKRAESEERRRWRAIHRGQRQRDAPRRR
jgi:ribosome biogenesis GTPase